jgi:exopolyphosphatase/guanosine-5'-triphosphate,3'-diphosphate pyrophosphatase
MEPASHEHIRLAAIDVGTNSVRLVIAEASADGSYRLLDDEKETTRLGQGLSLTGQLSARAMKLSAQAIARMKRIAEGYGVAQLRVVGTCAVREASNGNEFAALVRQEAGVALETISAEDEAKLAHLSVSQSFDLSGAAAAVVDIGGGSTEIVLSNGSVIEQISSCPLGAVRLTEQFDLFDQPAPKHLRQMRKAISRTLKAALGKPPFPLQVVIGTGGTFTALASVSMHHGEAGSGDDLLPFNVRGYEMQRSEVRHLIDRLGAMPLRARLRVPGLSPERAEIIVAGAAIVECIMKRLRVNCLRVHDRGIRDGLLLTMIREVFPASRHSADCGLDRLRGVRHFATACKYPERHSNHVAELATQIYDQLARQAPAGPGGWSDPANRELFIAAAILHDVGYYINYSKHHKHSYHLIMHSDLPGFSQRELDVIANVARYHRCALPKARHRNFARLARGDQRLVRHLAAILRIADGLDRAHTQEVRAVTVRVRGQRAAFRLDVEQEPHVEIWGAQRKRSLFERVFGLTPSFSWRRFDAVDSPDSGSQLAIPVASIDGNPRG